MTERIAVAVVSYNTRDLLRECLRSLDGDPRLDTWVADNASADGSADMVRAEFPGVRLIADGQNLGFGAAVNAVAARAQDWDWLAIANADIALEPGALDALLAAGAADPGAGALAPRLLRPDGSTQHSLYPFWSVPFALAFNAGLQRVAPRWADAQCLEGHWDPDQARRAPWAVGAFLLVRRAAWEAAGGFDPAQWLYAEDLDLGWRLRGAGWATRYEPAAHVRHAESASIAPVWGEARTERWMAASYDWMLRRRGRAVTTAVAAINVAGAAARRVLSRDPTTRRAAAAWARMHARGLRPAAVRERLPRPPGPT